MCESTVYIRGEKGKEMVMEEVSRVEVREGSVVISSLMGEKKVIRGRIASIDFLGHRMMIDPSA